MMKTTKTGWTARSGRQTTNTMPSQLHTKGVFFLYSIQFVDEIGHSNCLFALLTIRIRVIRIAFTRDRRSARGLDSSAPRS